MFRALFLVTTAVKFKLVSVPRLIAVRTMADSALAKAGISKSTKDITNAEWQKILSPEQYHIMREAGTEKAFSGTYVQHKADGTYHCAACSALLFRSTAKFDSHCGWPSFSEAAAEAGDDLNVIRRLDTSHGMERTEVLCKQCGSHLGHVFDDGPKPTGERFCINSVAINFNAKKE